MAEASNGLVPAPTTNSNSAGDQTSEMEMEEKLKETDSSAESQPFLKKRATSVYIANTKHIVYYAVRVHSLSNISNLDQSFDCSFDIIMEWKASADEMLQYIEDNEDDPSIKSLRTKLNEMNISGSSSSKDPDISTDRSENGGRDSRDEMLKKGLFMLKQMADKQIGTKPTKSTTIWKPPEIRFPNLMEHTQDPEDHGLQHIVVGDADPNTKTTEFMFKEKRSYNCRLRERMELESFPFDVQVCGQLYCLQCGYKHHAKPTEIMRLCIALFVNIQSFSIKMLFPVSTKYAQFVPLPGTFIEVEKMHNLSEFEMKQPLFVQDVERVRDFDFDQLTHTDDAEEFTTITIKLKGERNWKSYFYRIFVLSFLISLTLLLVFVTPAEEVADRLAHGVTILLTMVAFQFVVQTLLPQLGYLTFMDSYLLIADVYIAIVIIASCIPQLLYIEIGLDEDDMVVLDQVFFGTSFAVLILMTIAQMCYVKMRLIPKELEKLTEWHDSVKSADFTIEYKERLNKKNEAFFKYHDGDVFKDEANVFPAIHDEPEKWDSARFAIIKQLIDKKQQNRMSAKLDQNEPIDFEVEKYQKDHPPYKKITGQNAQAMKAKKKYVQGMSSSLSFKD